MSLVRALILICSVLAASACGSATSEQSADQTTAPVAVSQSPRIEAIDEPADAWLFDEPNDADVTADTQTLGLCGWRDSNESKDRECTAEDKEKMRRYEEEFVRATKPVKGSKPHAIAQLDLGGLGRGARLTLIAWKTQSGRLCLADDEEHNEGGGGGGPFGPCTPGDDCGAICLWSSGTGAKDGWVNTTAGVLPAEADVLRITFDGGRVASYRLDGPLVPGFPEYRVFLLDEGPAFHTRLELFDGDQLIAEEKSTDQELRFMRCDQQFPPTESLPAPEHEKSALMKCLDRAASE